jgi:ketosteroid isomerase-like protein
VGGAEVAGGAGVVERYFAAMMAHDWDGLRACLADDFSRDGPYPEHAWRGPDAYVAFVSGLLPGLRNHGVEVTRITPAGHVVHAELTETVELEGRQSTVRIANAFEVTADGRIRHVEVFVRRPPA